MVMHVLKVNYELLENLDIKEIVNLLNDNVAVLFLKVSVLVKSKVGINLNDDLPYLVHDPLKV